MAVRRRVVFTQNPGIADFSINGTVFAAHGKIASIFRPTVNTNEEWLIKNQSPEWRDSTSVTPGHSITIRQRFADHTGKFVFHCHVLVHEDHGMMAAIEVRP